MADTVHNKRSAGQPVYASKNPYFKRTSRPIYALFFLLPFIIFYEFGTILIDSELLHESHIRVVAFVWLQSFAESLGLTSYFTRLATPLLVVVVLFAFQIASRQSWALRLKDFPPMAGECIILAVPLIVFSALLSRPAGAVQDELTANSTAVEINLRSVQLEPAVQMPRVSAEVQTNPVGESGPKGSLLISIVTGIGAGIYEEFVFRLVLICLLMLFLEDVLGLRYLPSITLAVIVSAVLFSAHHHILFVDGSLQRGEALALWPFVFRTAAGLYFAALFALRGFGIAAGTHAFYDIIAALLNASLSAAQN